MDTKEQIKRSLSIVDVAALYVRLKPSGKNFKSLCPFHSEKTPSFSVVPERNTFHCFGCHKSGDIFTLVQEMENLSFPEAMDFLIERFNLPVERHRNTGRRPPMDAYLAANEAALRYFRANLLDGGEGERARRYLAERGLTEATLDAFSLGYARDSWDALAGQLRQDGADLDKAVELGLLGRSQGGRIYDRFRGRIMFPILSESGRVIAFGGRTLGDDSAKYLNSPESALFSKSRHLYGFHQARDHIRREGRAILVEGYFDVIALHQYGVRNAVAALGTALSGDQVHLLNRLSDDILLFYDGDDAGVQAALRGVECLLKHNVSPRVMECGRGVDPDDLVRRLGPRGVAERVEAAEDGFRFLLNRAMETVDPRRPEHQRQALEQVMQVVEQIPDSLVQREYRRRTADAFRISESLLSGRRPRQTGPEADRRQPLLVSPSEREFIQSLLAFPELLREIRPLLQDELIDNLTSRNLLRGLLQRYNESAGRFEDMEGIWTDLSEAECALLDEILPAVDASGMDLNAHCRRVQVCFLAFQERLNKQRIREINARIRLAEREDNQAEILRLMQQKNEYLHQKYRVSKEKSLDQEGA